MKEKLLIAVVALLLLLVLVLGFWPNSHVGHRSPLAKTDSARVIFTDPGIDDLFANVLLAKAANRGEINLLAAVSHYGCTTQENATRHTYRTYAGICPEVPVFRGSTAPIQPPPLGAGEEFPHYFDAPGGKSHGLCGLELPAPEHSQLPEDEGLARLANLIDASDLQVELVALGPATDVAKLLQGHPKVGRKISRITLMAGSLGMGNSGPNFAAEFNLYLDVKACCQVMKWAKEHRVPLVLVPWDMPICVFSREVKGLRSEDKWGKLCLEAMERYFLVHSSEGIPGDPLTALAKDDPVWYVIDPKVAIWLLRPDLCLQLPLELYVVTDSSALGEYGRTVTNRPKEGHEGPFPVYYVLPSQPELIRREMFRRIGIEDRR